MKWADRSDGRGLGKFFTGLCAVLLLIGLAGVCLGLRDTGQTVVQITQNGTVLYTLDLAQAEDQKIEVTYQGRTNIVEIADGHIQMAEAECPDQLCVQMGELRHAATPIVCLPNRLTIQFVDTAADVDSVSR